jgi:murein tripeptide amidase MpaA
MGDFVRKPIGLVRSRWRETYASVDTLNLALRYDNSDSSMRRMEERLMPISLWGGL